MSVLVDDAMIFTPSLAFDDAVHDLRRIAKVVLDNLDFG